MDLEILKNLPKKSTYLLKNIYNWINIGSIIETLFDQLSDVTHNVEIMCETTWFKMNDKQINNINNIDKC